MMNLLLGVIFLGVTSEPDFLPDAVDDAVEMAAREYRIQVYDTFRTDRLEFDSRAAEGRRVLRVWKRTGRDRGDGDLVMQWFAQATQASRGEQFAALPPLPASVADQPSFVENEVNDDEVEDDWNLDDQYTISKNEIDGQTSSGATTKAQANDSQQAATAEQAVSSPTQGGILRSVGRRIFGQNGAGRQNDARPAATPPELAVAQPQRVEPLTDEVDVEEIKAQVDGFNASISAIRASLSDDDPIATQALADSVTELEALAERRRDLEPYLSLEVLSTTERRHIGNLVSPTDTLINVYQRIDEQLTQANQSDGDSTELSVLLGDLRERVEKLLADPSQS